MIYLIGFTCEQFISYLLFTLEVKINEFVYLSGMLPSFPVTFFYQLQKSYLLFILPTFHLPSFRTFGTYQAQAFRLEQAEIKACQLVDITNYKTYAKGLMDIALLTSNANQLRQVVELCGSFKYVLVALLCLSILLQVLATVLLMVERIKCKGEDWANCVRSNAALL